MNQITRISVCKSVLRRNPFTRFSSKPMFSSLISKNHHPFLNSPPPIFSTPAKHFRKYSCCLLDYPKYSEETAAESNFDDDLLKIGEIHNKLDEARDLIAVGNEKKHCFLLWPHLEEAAVRARGAVKIASDGVFALVEKLGHTEKAKAHHLQLQRLGERIQSLNESLDDFVDFSEIYELQEPRSGIQKDFEPYLSSTAGYHGKIVSPPPCPPCPENPTPIRFFFSCNEQGNQHPQHLKLFDQVIIPTKTGQVSIFPGHPATNLLLKPGVVSLVSGNETTKYFISSGYALVHPHSRVEVVTDQEAIPLDHFDPAKVQRGLAEFTQKLSSASTDLEKVEAQIGLEVHNALNAALQELVEEKGAGTSTQLN